MSDIEIRAGDAGDFAALETLYPAAFPAEDLLSLVSALLREPEDVVLSLVALTGATLVGHILFTVCGIRKREATVALLGPLAVAPAYQQTGVGAALIKAGLSQVKTYNVSRVLVLGDPVYYGRFGFAPESEIEPPYPLPEEWREAWQSIKLGETNSSFVGKLQVPPAWHEPTLWEA